MKSNLLIKLIIICTIGMGLQNSLFSQEIQPANGNVNNKQPDVNDIKDALKSDKKLEKMKAIKFASKSKNDLFVSELYDIASSENETLMFRVAAINAIENIASENALNALIKLAENKNKKIQIQAFSALQHFPRNSVVKLGIESLSNENNIPALTLLENITELRFDSPDDWQNWWNSLSNKDIEFQYIAILENNESSTYNICKSINKLSKAKSVNGVPFIMQMLDNKKNTIVEAASNALYNITGFQFVIENYNPQKDKNKLLEAWTKWWDENENLSKIQWWIKGLNRENQLQNRVSSINHLAQEEANQAIPYMIDLLEDPSKVIKSSVNKALIKITKLNFGYDAEADEEIQKKVVNLWTKWWNENSSKSRSDWLADALLSSEFEYNRASAAYNLRFYPQNKKAVGALIYGLRDLSQTVREYSISSLKYISNNDFGYKSDLNKKERDKIVTDKWFPWYKQSF